MSSVAITTDTALSRQFEAISQLYADKTEAHARSLAETLKLEREKETIGRLCDSLWIRLKEIGESSLVNPTQVHSESGPQVEMTAVEPSSLAAMVIEAAKKAKEMEVYQQIISDMYVKASMQAEEMHKKLEENVKKEHELLIEIQRLKGVVDKFETEYQTSRAEMLQSPGLLALTQGTEDINQPSELKERNKHLSEHVTTLKHRNEKWEEICKNLKQQIDDAKRILEEIVKNRPAGNERQEQDVANQTLNDLAVRVRRVVERLEADVVELQQQLLLQEQTDLTTSRQQNIDADIQLAFKYQTEEYNKSLAEIQTQLDIAHNQKLSMDQQWESQRQQLKKAEEEKQKLNQKITNLTELLRQTSIDKGLIESYISENPSSVLETVSKMVQEKRKPAASSSTTWRSTLEEDGDGISSSQLVTNITPRQRTTDDVIRTKSSDQSRVVSSNNRSRSNNSSDVT